MRRSLRFLIVGVSLSLTTISTLPAHAGDGEVAAGIIGGLAAGTLFGAAIARPHYEYVPPSYEDEPPPVAVYVVPGRACYWAHGRAYWDDDYDRWVYPRVRVCR